VVIKVIVIISTDVKFKNHKFCTHVKIIKFTNITIFGEFTLHESVSSSKALV